MNRFVYLAGPVLGMTESMANDWRRKVADKLRPHGIIGISPLRCEPIHGPTYEAGYPDERFGTARAIMAKNMFDVKTCDMVLAYIPHPFQGEHHSWGTMQELAWGRAFDKPVILVSDDPRARRIGAGGLYHARAFCHDDDCHGDWIDLGQGAQCPGGDLP